MTQFPNDQRRFGRRETNWEGRISWGERRFAQCVVRDVSVGGALLVLLEPVWVPYSFTLDIPASGFKTICEVRHQRELRIGVEFVGATASIAKVPERTSVAAGNNRITPPSLPRTAQGLSVSELRAMTRRH